VGNHSLGRLVRPQGVRKNRNWFGRGGKLKQKGGGVTGGTGRAQVQVQGVVGHKQN